MKRQMIAGIGAGIVLTAAVIWSEAVRGEVLAAGERCLTVLIPSLYLYTLLAAFCIRSGGLSALARRCGSAGMLPAVLIFSQIGGYPVGTQLLHELRLTGNITPQQERRALCICIGCGPGFLLGTVCRGMPPGMMLWLLLSLSLPNLLLGAVFLRDLRPQTNAVPWQGFARTVTEAADSAAQAMMKITAMVMAFAAVMGIWQGSGIPDRLPLRISAGIRTVLEVSSVTEFLRTGGSLPAAAAFLAFGGICVHLQLAAVCAGNVDWLRLWLFRGISAVCSYGICWCGVHFLFRDAAAASLTRLQPALTNSSILPGLCLLLMSLLLLRRHSVITFRKAKRHS